MASKYLSSIAAVCATILCPISLHQPAVAQTSPIPPPVVQVGANCDRPEYATDHLVCSDPGLLSLDHEMRRQYASVLMPENMTWLEEQGAWVRRRSLCAFEERHRTCVAEAYKERINTLGSIASRPPLILGPTVCQGVAVVWKAELDGNVVFYDASENPVIVASGGEEPFAVWMSFAKAEDYGGLLTITFADGRMLNCMTQSL